MKCAAKEIWQQTVKEEVSEEKIKEEDTLVEAEDLEDMVVYKDEESMYDEVCQDGLTDVQLAMLADQRKGLHARNHDQLNELPTHFGGFQGGYDYTDADVAREIAQIEELQQES